MVSLSAVLAKGCYGEVGTLLHIKITAYFNFSSRITLVAFTIVFLSV